MSLALKRIGQGPDLVLLHGWGMNAAVWGEFADRLTQRYRLWLIDLPGHGESDYAGETGLSEWSMACLNAAPSEALWLGWSLGAEIAIQAALEAPDRVRAVIAICGTPRFAQGANWPNAMEEKTLQQFIAASHEDHRKTLERFLALQVRGSDQAREGLRLLKLQLRAKPEPLPEALDAGLELLKAVDLRDNLARLTCSLSWLFGERDTLIPAAVADDLHKWLPDTRTEVIPGAAHAPFLSHPVETLKTVEQMLAAANAKV